MSGQTGVLVLSYGTPRTREGIEPYYTRIRRGRPPSPEQLADLVKRYDAIGGTSPLNDRTQAQVDGITRELERRSPGRFLVANATRYEEPSIEEAASALAASGVDRVIGLVLAPLSAAMSTGQYHDRAESALDGLVPYVPIWAWWDAPGFCEIVAANVQAAIAGTPEGSRIVVFSAHALPVRVVAEGGDYAEQLADAAGRIASLAGLREYAQCWQSAGRTEEEWLGPDILDYLRSLDPAETSHVVVCPVGFVSDHLEVLYDVDIEADHLARELGISLRRTPSLNDDPRFLEVLADIIERKSTP
jgi:ferrochelatase